MAKALDARQLSYPPIVYPLLSIEFQDKTMTRNTAPVVPLLAPKEVPLSQIQTELNTIWEKAAAEQNGNNTSAARASTFSLLVYEPSEAQTLLKNLGYYSGPIDGIFGPRMQAALHAAQGDP